MDVALLEFQMIHISEAVRQLPFYAPIPLTELPLLFHREHLFPYTSFGETASDPVIRHFRVVVLENDFLRVEVAPELGGRVYSLFDKRIHQEILFSNPVVRPVRILPIWGFISGGIEFNFPIAHSPTSLAEVGCATGRLNEYAFVRVGEREARTGMEWVVELGLHESLPALIQRTALRNQSGQDHPWMMWTIAAARSTEGTEFIHPPHRVLVHNRRVMESDWPGVGLNWERNLSEMTALFWKPGSAPHFGVFHHDLGFGLMHLADPNLLPGKKIWTYGHGPDRQWGKASTDGTHSYLEIESGPLLDQSEKPLFPAGAEKRFEEYWYPVHSRGTCEGIALPSVSLPPWPEPWLGWRHSAWQLEWEQFRSGEGGLPCSVVPTGLALEPALREIWTKGNGNAARPLALWLAFRNRTQEALAFLENDNAPEARRLSGLLLWKSLVQPTAAVESLEAGPLHDPFAIVELDELYSELGLTEKRCRLLSNAPPHRRIIERRADLALSLGDARQALQLLSETNWPREHQRYIRSQLWQKAKAALGEPEEIPSFLHEDHLAPFGAYWSD